MGTDCPAGSYDDDSDVETECVFCPAGYSSNAGGVGLSNCTREDGKQSVAGGLCVDLSCDIYGALPGPCVMANAVLKMNTRVQIVQEVVWSKCQYHADQNPDRCLMGLCCVSCPDWSYGNLHCTEGSLVKITHVNLGKCLDVCQQMGEDTWNQQMGEYTWKCLCPPGQYGDLCQYDGYSHFKMLILLNAKMNIG